MVDPLRHAGQGRRHAGGRVGHHDHQPRCRRRRRHLDGRRQRFAALCPVGQHRDPSRRHRHRRIPTAPSPARPYQIDGANYTTVFDAFEAVDTRIDDIDSDVSEVTDRAVRYDGAEGDAKDTITLEGATGTTITNLRPGLLDATSTDAVNGSQLFATNQLLAELDDSAVKYDMDINGDRTNTVTLIGGDPNAPVLVKNVAAGVDDTDAVNVAQLEDGLATTLIAANIYADSLVIDANEEVIDIANEYTDLRVSQLSAEIGGVRDEARQAAAIGLAASSIRYDDTPGKFSVGMGGGFWRGQGAAAFGAGYTSEGGRLRANASAAVAGGAVGGGAGISFTLN